MNLKKSLFILGTIALFGSLSLVSAQENVLEQARQKYDKNQAKNATPASETTLPEASAKPQTTTSNTTTTTTTSNSTTTTTTIDQSGLTVDIKVKVQFNDKPADSDTAQNGRQHFFIFELVPNPFDDYRNDSTIFAFTPIMCDIGSVSGVVYSLLLGRTHQVNGLQIADIGNFADRLNGLQSGGIFNIVERNANGLQSAGIFNISQDLNGLQSAGIFNIAAKVSGMQASGIFNTATNVNGVQAAGIANTAQDLTGVQASGIVNVARKVQGVQLGLVNISEDLDGVALGLVNICKNGINELSAWYESNNMYNVALMNGSRNFYTIAQVGELGTDLFQNANSLSAALGFGARLGSNDGFYLQADLSTRALIDVNGTYTPPVKDLSALGWKTISTTTVPCPVSGLFPSLRLGLGLNMGHHFGIFGGTTIDFGSSVWNVAPIYQSPLSGSAIIGGQTYTAYVKWSAGVSLR